MMLTIIASHFGVVCHSDYRNKRIGDKYLLGIVIAEPNRRTVDAASGDSTRRAVVGEFRVMVPTGEVMRISTYNPSKQQVK